MLASLGNVGQVGYNLKLRPRGPHIDNNYYYFVLLGEVGAWVSYTTTGTSVSETDVRMPATHACHR
jgi:hypothetical protein